MYPTAFIIWFPYQPNTWGLGDQDWRKLPELNLIFLEFLTSLQHLGLIFPNSLGDLF